MTAILGFTASALIITSVTMRSVVWLRTLGFVGSLTFITYGIALAAWPIVATNMVTTAVHLYRLRAMANGRSAIGAPLLRSMWKRWNRGGETPG